MQTIRQENLREVMRRIDDHLRFAARDSSDLPPDLGRIIELLCSAGRDILERQRLLIVGPRTEKHRNLHGMFIAGCVERAVEQTQKALQQIQRLNTADTEAAKKSAQPQ